MAVQQFFSVYPKRSNARDIHRAMTAALTKATIGSLMAKAAEYAKSVSGKEERFIIGPAKWLEDEQWKNSWEPAEKTKQKAYAGF